jgi:hypothetical protein
LAKTAAWVLMTANALTGAQAMAHAPLWSESSCLMRFPMFTETACYLEVSDVFVTRAGRALTVLCGPAPTSAPAKVHAHRMVRATATRTGLVRIARQRGARTNAIFTGRVLEVEDACAIWDTTE